MGVTVVLYTDFSEVVYSLFTELTFVLVVGIRNPTRLFVTTFNLVKCGEMLSECG